MAMADVARADLHEQIPADCWCVTRKDLKLLRRQVRQAIAGGAVRPTATDPFDPSDDVIGPNVYTVTDQFVKPTLAENGVASWALMQHPDGLKCDLFVTHAWAEGTFEIIDKVLASWPPRARHAWICFLANPQNSNIAALVSRPQSSPFALALQSATYMLVVANTKSSIYCRLWCAYEAYLAYKWDKFIFMATHSIWPHYWKVVPPLALCALAGGATAQVWRLHLPFSSDTREFIMWSSSMLAVFITFLALRVSNRLRRACNRACSFLAAHAMALHFFKKDKGEYYTVWAMMFVSGVLYFFAAELDRVRSTALKLATEELSRDYTGSISAACCSVATDEQSIRAEIGDCTEEVDKTIHVLLRAGISTPPLRKAADLGVDMSGLGRKDLSFASTFTLGSAAVHVYEVFLPDPLLKVLSSIALFWICAFIAFIYLTGHERRVCAARLVELSAVAVMLPVLLVSFRFLGTVPALMMGAGNCILQWILCLSLSIAGVENVAAVPLVGLAVAQLMAGRPPSNPADEHDGPTVLQRASSFQQFLKRKASRSWPGAEPGG